MFFLFESKNNYHKLLQSLFSLFVVEVRKTFVTQSDFIIESNRILTEAM
jgi:hypothetical protein